MEISSRILREVEFRDRLRGYDTDEVDEFLEKIAVGVDELRAQLAAALEQGSQAAQGAPRSTESSELGFADDAAIRRTLVLAQRTADLAIKEAESEALRLLEEARTEAESTLARARDEAQRARDAAEFGLQERVHELTDQSARLEREVEALNRLLEKERERLSDALSSALRFVNDSLVASEDLATARPSAAPVEPAPPTYESAVAPSDDEEPMNGIDVASPPVYDDDDEIEGATGEAPATGGLPRFDFAADIELDQEIVAPSGGAAGAADEDEELWERWARSSPPEGEEPPGGRRPGLFDRDPRQP